MSMEKMRDSIDFKNTDIKTLFRKLLLPTVPVLWHRYGCFLRVWDLCSASAPLW